MRSLPLSQGLRQVLFLGAHCDDVEIGCGGTLATLARTCPQAQIHVVVLSGADAARAAETRTALARLTAPHALDIEIHEFRDGFFPTAWADIKERLEAIKRRLGAPGPDVVFTHYEQDRHQDHRTVAELTWNTFRNHLILEYEIPKWDGDLGRPAVYLPLTRDIVTHKTAALLESFPTQAGKRWFTEDLFSGLMRLRGMECNAESGFAEAFYARKVVVGW